MVRPRQDGQTLGTAHLLLEHLRRKQAAFVFDALRTDNDAHIAGCHFTERPCNAAHEAGRRGHDHAHGISQAVLVRNGGNDAIGERDIAQIAGIMVLGVDALHHIGAACPDVHVVAFRRKVLRQRRTPASSSDNSYLHEPHASFLSPRRRSVPVSNRWMFWRCAQITMRADSVHSPQASQSPQKKYAERNGHSTAAATEPSDT